MDSNTGAPQPEWDAQTGEWVSGDFRWDAQAQQWLPRSGAPAAPGASAAAVTPQPVEASAQAAEPVHPVAAEPVQPAAVAEPVQPVQPVAAEPVQPVLPVAAEPVQPAAAEPVQPTAYEPAQPAAYAPTQPATPQHPTYPGAPGAAPAPAAYAAQQPYPGNPAEAYPGYAAAPPAAPKKKLGTGALIAIIAGGVVLLLAIVFGVVFAVSGGGASAEQRPEAVVEKYLQALADGDSETALALLSTKPTDRELLTDEALAASNKLGAIDDIVVTLPKGTDLRSGDADVTADYTIGGKPVTGEFTVVDYKGDGSWEIQRGTVDLYIGSRLEGLPTQINGIAIDNDSITVFPGTVALTVDNPNYTLSGTTTAIISDPSDYSSDGLDPKVGLSDAGLAAFRQGITDSVNTCLASKSLDPGCGLAIGDVLSDGTKVIDGTITRTLTASAQAEMASLEPDELYSDPLKVHGPYIGGVDVTADCESNGQSYTGCTFLFMPTLGSPLVDFSTDPVTVRWGN